VVTSAGRLTVNAWDAALVEGAKIDNAREYQHELGRPGRGPQPQTVFAGGC
jgi:hypothetical protein